jgi:hypothetical protein
MPMTSRFSRTTLVAILGSVACAGSGSSDRTTAPPSSLVDTRMVDDEARASLAILEARASGGIIGQDAWQRLWSSEGYRRLKRREAAMGRAFSDSVFQAFLLSDTLGARRTWLAATLAAWQRADVTGASRLALSYLPAGTRLRARIYPMIKPQTNSFVFDVGTDSAAIFLYLDPAVGREKLENTLAHELHHIGHATACAGTADTTFPEPVQTARGWLGAFGEGVAVLAAAGGPARHPHQVSDSTERARWDRDYANVAGDLRRIESFVLDVVGGRLAEPGAIRQRAMSFFGEAQGPWYTVGYLMASTIERVQGRRSVVEVLCHPPALLERYNAAAAALESRTREPLPRWSREVLAALAARQR